MDIEFKSKESKEPNKPQVFVKSIMFNDGTVLNLNHDSIVVFTGANNSGKSQVLCDIESFIKDSRNISVILSNLSPDYMGELDDDFIIKKIKGDNNGRY